MADTKANRAKLKKRRTEQGEQTAIPKGKSISPGIVKTTRPVQTERRFRGKEQIGDTKTTFKEEFKSKETGERFTGGNVPTVPNFTPLKGLTQENLTELGVENPETIDLEKLQRRQALEETQRNVAGETILPQDKGFLETLGQAGTIGIGSKDSPFGILSQKNPKIAGALAGGVMTAGAVTAGIAVANLMIGGGAIAGGGSSTAVITRAIPGTSVVTQRAFIGRPATSGINKIFSLSKGRQFATNTKSLALTKSSLLKRGLSAGAVTFIAGMFGSYPMSAWAKQEVLGAIKIGSRDAREAGDFETVRKMIELREEVAKNSWWKELPYKNVVEEFVDYFKADKLAIVSERRLMAEAIRDQEGEGIFDTEFEASQKRRDELKGGGEDDGRE